MTAADNPAGSPPITALSTVDRRSVPMTAEITLSDHPDGTDYRVVVRHGDPITRSRHEDLGFRDGWGAVIEQLARFAESASMR